MRPPRLTGDRENLNGQYGSKAITESSQKGHQDFYQLQRNQQSTHNAVAGSTNLEYGEGETLTSILLLS
jgi:hypothetical protein